MTAQKLARSAAAAGLLVLALAGCGGDDSSTDATKGPPVGAADRVEVKDFSFNPQSTTVKTGTTVTWTFSDDTDHNVEPVGASELTKSPDLQGGKTFTFKFTKAGTVSYRCGIHNSMSGTVNVTA